MSEKAISPLRRRMIEDMTIRKFAPKTRHDYVQRVKNFAAFLGRSPDTATFEDVRRYQLHLAAGGGVTFRWKDYRVEGHERRSTPWTDRIAAMSGRPALNPLGLRRQNRLGIRWKRQLRIGVIRQLLAMKHQGRSNPERVCQMIPARVRRVRMDQNAQAAVVEHQPRHQRRKYLTRKGDLKHRLVVRADFHVMPATQGDGKTFADPCSQLLGFRSRGRGIVIDVSVKACDLAGRPGAGTLGQVRHLCFPRS